MKTFPAKRLTRHADRLRQTSLRTLLTAGEDRAFLCREIGGLYLDASRQRLDGAAWKELLTLAPAIEQARDQLLSGAHVNVTEDCPALHTALRDPRPSGPTLNGVDIGAQVHEQLQRMQAFARTASRWRTVINLGVGGSDLGPRLLCEVLPKAAGAPDVRFVSTPDPQDLRSACQGCDAKQTLFIVASKSFATEETQQNFQAARRWLRDQGVADSQWSEHFIASTAVPQKARAEGFSPAQIFTFWDWVGGRYSLWSVIGLPVILHAGFEAFANLLDGAHQMDRHFAQAPSAENLPMLLGLLLIWNHACLGATSQAVLPYNFRLRTLTRYLQQLQMESLGKSTDVAGQPREVAAPVVWGGPGNDGAHAFFQYLHQSGQIVPVDVVLVQPNVADPRECLLAGQCLAQIDLLAWGQTAEEVGQSREVNPQHRVYPGGRPSRLLLLERLDARNVGALLAAYEHATFVAASAWGINAFDQFGVECGKRRCRTVADALADATAVAPGHTLSALIKRLSRSR